MLSRPLLDRVAFFGISWYAILITGAIVIGYLLASGEARRLHLPQDTVIDFLLYAIPLGLICARLYYVAFRFNDYSEDLLSVFNIREGGMAIYGGVIGGLIAALMAYLSALRPQEYNVLHHRFLNAGAGAPECFVVQRQ